jgi:hypothetical protein
VNLSKQKVKISKEAWEMKIGSNADYLQDLITLTRFEENRAQALQTIANVEAEIAELLAMQKAAKPADELAKLKDQHALVEARIDELRRALDVAKATLVLAANRNDQKARDAAGLEVEKIHASLLEGQKLEQELRDKIAKLQDRTEARGQAVREKAFQLLKLEAEANQATLKALEDQINKLKAEQEALGAEAEKLARRRDVYKLKMAQLKRDRAAEGGLKQLGVAGRTRPTLK